MNVTTRPLTLTLSPSRGEGIEEPVVRGVGECGGHSRPPQMVIPQ
jgi:hypothetical protein